MKHLKVNRKFDMMFPNISAEEKQFEGDLLTHGRLVAENNRRIRETVVSTNITRKMNEYKDTTLESLLNIWYIYKFDETNGQEEYYLSEKDENDQIIVDKEKKCVRFKDERTGKVIEKFYQD